MEIKPVEKIGNYKIYYDNEHGIGFVPLDPKALEMTAKDMFKELGYHQLYQNKHYMFYVKDLIDTPEYEKDSIHLEFNFDNKTFNKTYSDDNSVYEITLDELKAINKQIEELGWFNNAR